MNPNRTSVYPYSLGLGVLLVSLLFGVSSSYAQYGGGYNQGYNQYGNNQGYNQGNGNYGNQYGGSMMGGMGRMGGMGGMGMGGGMMGSMGGRGGRSSRGGRNSGYNQGSGGRNSYNSYNGGQTSQGMQGNNPMGGQTSPGKSSSSGKTQQKGALSPAGAAAGGEGGVAVQGKVPTGAMTPGGPAGPRSQPVKKPQEPKMRPTAQFMLVSRSTIAIVSEPYTVEVRLLNPAKMGFDRLNYELKYNPADFLPIAGEDSPEFGMPVRAVTTDPPAEEKTETANADTPVQDMTAKSGEPAVAKPLFLFQKSKTNYKVTKNQIDPKKGVIHFSGRVETETCTDSGTVSRITFLPLRPNPQSLIAFSFGEPNADQEGAELLTGLTLKNQDQLGSKFSLTDGVINLNVEIYSSREKIPNRAIVKKAGDRTPEEGKTFSTHLSLIPRRDKMEVGDFVDVDIYLANPDQEVIDGVSLLIAYNPRVLEPIKGDDSSQGITVDDANYRDKFPFDFPILNTINTDQGIIDYRKRGYKKPVRGEGVLATLHFRAIRPTQKTTFRIFMNENGEEPTTSVQFRNKDRLGDPSDPFDGVTTASLEIRPTLAYLKKIGKSGS